MPKTNAERQKQWRENKKNNDLVEYRYYPGIRPKLKDTIDKYIKKLMLKHP